MINLIIVGTGAVAAEVTSYLNSADYKWEGKPIYLKGYLEYTQYSYLHKHYLFEKPILGDIDNYEIDADDFFIIANANVTLRKDFYKKLSERGAKFINLIHPTCIISKTAHLGVGNILSPYCQIGPVAQVGDFNIMTSNTMISHDCTVGNLNSFSTSVICGHVSIGNENSFYIRSTVVPQIKIGNNCIVQSGMVVDKDIPDGTTVFYKFKERILAIPQS